MMDRGAECGEGRARFDLAALLLGRRGEAQVFGEIDEFHATAAERPGDAVTSADDGVGLDHAGQSRFNISTWGGATKIAQAHRADGPTSTSSRIAPANAALLAQIR